MVAVAEVGEAGRAVARSEVAPRRIWLVADDYGISPAVSAAIRDLIVRGRLNATSVMAVAPSLNRPEALALDILNAGGRRVAIGLHLTLTAPFRPLTKEFRPLHDGAFPPLLAMMRAAFLRRLARAPIAAEVRAQFAQFNALFGHPPDFVDGHQHVHLLPLVRDAVLAAVKEVAPAAWVRQCGSARPLHRHLFDHKGFIIDRLSRGLVRRAARLGIATNPAFAGTYDFRPDADFAALFPGFLDGLPAGGVVMCHPGTVDAELTRLDPLTHLREREYAYLLDATFPRVLAERGVALA